MFGCRSDNAIVKAGLDSLEPDDLKFIQDRRRELLEHLLEDISNGFQTSALQRSWKRAKTSELLSLSMGGAAAPTIPSLSGAGFQPAAAQPAPSAFGAAAAAQTTSVDDGAKQALSFVGGAIQRTVASHNLDSNALTVSGTQVFGSGMRPI